MVTIIIIIMIMIIMMVMTRDGGVSTVVTAKIAMTTNQ